MNGKLTETHTRTLNKTHTLDQGRPHRYSIISTSLKYNRSQLSSSVLWFAGATHTETDTLMRAHIFVLPCLWTNSPSIVRDSNGVDQIQQRHPRTFPPSLSPNPPSCVTAGPFFLPSFLPSDTEALPSHRGVRMAGCASTRQMDWQWADMQTGGCSYCGLWTGFSSHPQRRGAWHHLCFDRATGRSKETGRRTAAGFVVESTEKYATVKGCISGDQWRDQRWLC